MHPPLLSALGPILCRLMLAFCMLPLFQCLYVPWRCWLSEPYFLDVLQLLWFLLSFSLLYCRVWRFLLGDIREYSILHCSMDSLSRAEVLETSETIHCHSLLLGVAIHTEILGWLDFMHVLCLQSELLWFPEYISLTVSRKSVSLQRSMNVCSSNLSSLSCNNSRAFERGCDTGIHLETAMSYWT